jgi:hypothetical protein
VNLGPEHIDSYALTRQKLEFLSIAEKLDKDLLQILLEELELGNRIHEASEDNNERRVSLIRPFTQTYSAPDGVYYSEETDPHYNACRYVVKSELREILSAPYR